MLRRVTENCMTVLPFLVSRESTDPTNLIKPLTQQINQNEKTNMKKQKEKKLEKKVLYLMRSFIDNDPTERFLNFLASES